MNLVFKPLKDIIISLYYYILFVICVCEYFKLLFDATRGYWIMNLIFELLRLEIGNILFVKSVKCIYG